MSGWPTGGYEGPKNDRARMKPPPRSATAPRGHAAQRPVSELPRIPSNAQQGQSDRQDMRDTTTTVNLPRFIVEGVIKSFRERESNRELYDAATHRWIDGLAEAVADYDRTNTAEPDPLPGSLTVNIEEKRAEYNPNHPMPSTTAGPGAFTPIPNIDEEIFEYSRNEENFTWHIECRRCSWRDKGDRVQIGNVAQYHADAHAAHDRELGYLGKQDRPQIADNEPTVMDSGTVTLYFQPGWSSTFSFIHGVDLARVKEVTMRGLTMWFIEGELDENEIPPRRKPGTWINPTHIVRVRTES